jgi:uncharacterized protein YbjT (DUF2867 family)
MPRRVLIVGATGQQGSATVNALLALPESVTADLHIVGLTRNSTSAKAQSLQKAHPSKISFQQGDWKDPKAVFASLTEKVDSLYLFTMPGTPEDVLGKAWIDAALSHGVSQIVMSTVDRGGNDVSWDTPTPVPHFAQKQVVETYLRDSSIKQWTVLRPAAFYDNLNPGVFCSLFNAMWATMPPSKSLQMVSTRDIGLFAANAFADPAGWHGKAIALAGDDLTLDQAKETFNKVVGQQMPQAWGIFARLMFFMLSDVRKMFAWLGTDGYGTDIEALRRTEPRLQDFETWLKESSRWKAKNK